ncbi:hypothetical protein BJ973_003175 [Actinoplanes tereljensis]|uniref:Uncharacterized protein n=1 Tax=Paractinoplanes tereljensis TaxID=571912 RepID=A0A919NX18_9ACTN|nr:hypothetical protein [Actinoplanes tereljensis]GIF25903.1 hypothetical protein Ate02nite_86330 [Actinoplanes tereljensis]
MLYASTRLNESTDQKVFVDSSGRRKRMLTVAGLVVAAAAALYIGVVGVSVLQAPQTGLTTKGTVTPTSTAKAGG